MKPDQIAKSGTEHGEQVALFAWCAVAMQHGFEVADAWAAGADLPKLEPGVKHAVKVPELRWFHAIPNGGSRGDDAKSRTIRGGQLKAEGVRVGVSDTFLPVKRGYYSGLYIEMKKPSLRPKKIGAKGAASDEQIEFGNFVRSQGFGFVVCYSWREAADNVRSYLQHGG